MNDFYKFATQMPWLAALLAILALSVVYYLPIRMWSRLMRCLSIRKAGWPPPHLDADGDFQPRATEDEAEEG